MSKHLRVKSLFRTFNFITFNLVPYSIIIFQKRRCVMDRKGQGSTEMLIIIAVSLIIVLTFITLNYDLLRSSDISIRNAKSRAILDQFQESGQLVYRQGTGSRVKISISVPPSVKNFTFDNQSIIVNFEQSNSTVYRNLGFPVRGSIPKEEGTYFITIQSFSDAVNFFQTDISNPATVTNLRNTSQGTTWITWAWTNPADTDFNNVKIYLDGTFVTDTNSQTYTTSGLLTNTSYMLTLVPADYTGNLNSTNVSAVASTIYPTAFIPAAQNLKTKTCIAQDKVNQSYLLSGDCDGIYPVSCGVYADLISCDDSYSETHLAQRVNITYSYGGIQTSYFNNSVLNCFNITKVYLCHEWWRDAALQNCDISVDADGGSNYSVVTTTCPGLSPPGVTCTDVTSLETWQCSNFFGTTGTRAKARSEAQRSGGKGTTIISWDAFYFNVSYNEV
jgi:hypothetical protein